MKFPTSDLQTFQDASRQHNINRTLGRHPTPIPMGAALVVCRQDNFSPGEGSAGAVFSAQKRLLNQSRWSRTDLVLSPISFSSLWRHKKALNCSFHMCSRLPQHLHWPVVQFQACRAQRNVCSYQQHKLIPITSLVISSQWGGNTGQRKRS